MSANTPAIDESNFQSEVLESTVPVIVDFWAPWCGPCLRLGPILEEIAGEFPDSLKVVKVNVDENQALAAQYGVRSIPFLIYVKDGAVKSQSVGLESKDKIVSRVQAL